MKTVEQFSNDLNARWDQDIRNRNDGAVRRGVADYAIPSMGLMGEAGEAGEHFKKFIRDGVPVFRNARLAFELGDVLHYLCRCADLAGYTLQELAMLNEHKLATRRAEAENRAKEALPGETL